MPQLFKLYPRPAAFAVRPMVIFIGVLIGNYDADFLIVHWQVETSKAYPIHPSALSHEFCVFFVLISILIIIEYASRSRSVGTCAFHDR